jgi:L-ribulose-5-phosphate 4-epimerase
MISQAPPLVTRLRRELVDLHHLLLDSELVVWTAGNVSARIPGTDQFLIKPSGVDHLRLTPESMVLCDLDGRPVMEGLAPSSDVFAHAYVYRHRVDVGGVVHTHSTYATAWAARGESIPCVLTAMADEFGGEIPIGPFALIGGEEIGRGVVDTLAGHRSPAVLMRNHGVFTVGGSPREALKAAVMCEDVARTVHISRQLGTPIPLEPGDVDLLFDRYQNVYGQRSAKGAGR